MVRMRGITFGTLEEISLTHDTLSFPLLRSITFDLYSNKAIEHNKNRPLEDQPDFPRLLAQIKVDTKWNYFPVVQGYSNPDNRCFMNSVFHLCFV